MPSAKVLEQKKQVVADLTEKLKGAVAGVIVDYRGLTVDDDTKLRSEFRKAGVQYAVVKNTLLRFASNEVGYNELDGILHGPTALATSNDDIIAPAKIVAEFAKKNTNLEIKAGFVEGKVVGIDEIKAIADTPSKEVLIAKLMGSLNAPIASLVRALNAIAEKGESGENAAPAIEEKTEAVESPVESSVEAVEEAKTEKAVVETKEAAEEVAKAAEEVVESAAETTPPEIAEVKEEIPEATGEETEA